jgi:hypothetical protein
VTGPEHYIAAEEMLAHSHQGEPGSVQRLANLAAAQIHATLASAAAAAVGDRDFHAWFEAAGPRWTES